MEAILLFVVLPLLFANVVHQMVVLRHNLFAFLAKPLDAGCTLRGKRIFGAHKTLRGLVVVSLCTAICTFAITLVRSFPFAIHPALFGFLLGLAYMLGELPNSFLKRQYKIPPGRSTDGCVGFLFSIIDHIDSVIAVAIVLMVLIHPSPATLLILVLCGGVLHYIVHEILHGLGYRK